MPAFLRIGLEFQISGNFDSRIGMQSKMFKRISHRKPTLPPPARESSRSVHLSVRDDVRHVRDVHAALVPRREDHGAGAVVGFHSADLGWE